MPDDDWIDQTGWSGDELHPDPPALPPGQRLVAVICCPSCQSLAIARYSTAANVSYWRCGGCAESWKLAASIGRERAYLL